MLSVDDVLNSKDMSYVSYRPFTNGSRVVYDVPYVATVDGDVIVYYVSADVLLMLSRIFRFMEMARLRCTDFYMCAGILRTD